MPENDHIGIRVFCLWKDDTAGERACKGRHPVGSVYRGLVGNEVLGGGLGHAGHELLLVFGSQGSETEVSTTATLDSHKANFGLLRGLDERVP